MKKLIALLLIVAALLALTGCKDDFYEPVESTAEEAKAVMTLRFGSKTYEVRYELYRALFLTYKSEVDGGNDSVWSGADSQKYVEKIQALILGRAVEIYSTFALAQSIGIDPYSTEVGKKVNEYVNLSVDGGDHGGVTYPGYDSYEDYLEALHDMYLNYSVQTLLFRYAIVSDMIDDYYMGTLTEEDIEAGVKDVVEGHLEYTRDDVHAFYNSEDCVRVLRTFVSDEMDTAPLARAERVRAAIIAAASGGESSVRRAMINQGSTTSVPELESGYVIGKYNLTRSYFGKMVDVAFALNVGEVGEIVSVHDGSKLSHYIIYRAEKSEAHFEDNYASIAYIYLRNEIGKKYDSTARAMADSVSYTPYLESLDHSAISMD